MGSSQTRARTRVPCIGRQILNHYATREAPLPHFYKCWYIWNIYIPYIYSYVYTICIYIHKGLWLLVLNSFILQMRNLRARERNACLESNSLSVAKVALYLISPLPWSVFPLSSVNLIVILHSSLSLTPMVKPTTGPASSTFYVLSPPTSPHCHCPCAGTFPQQLWTDAGAGQCSAGHSCGSRFPDWVLIEKALHLCTREIDVTITPVMHTSQGTYVDKCEGTLRV